MENGITTIECKKMKKASRFSGTFNINDAVRVPMGMLNLLNEFTALQLLSSPDYLSVFGYVQLEAQAVLAYDLYLHGYEIANVFRPMACSPWNATLLV
ncbi:MAG: hypothetical protein JJE17_00945 [Peptostreptococcaceae bacterium]|nr:hypothetical protein [Peptostreptococcaceae bacterium]